MVANGTTPLQSATLSRLQQLIRLNLDSCDGLMEVAEKVDDAHMAGLFRQIGTERSVQAGSLQGLVSLNPEPGNGSTHPHSDHQSWIDLRAVLSESDPKIIVSEVERGEKKIKQTYEQVLQETVGTAIHEILQQQYAQVETSYELIHDLRKSLE